MLRRVRGYLLPRKEAAPASSRQLQEEGYTHLQSVFSASELAALIEECDGVYRDYPRDGRAANRPPEEDEDFRYEMFNRSPLAQKAIAHPEILATIEPLLGEDCHVIANTCWRNPPRETNQHGGGFWHIDAGPHVPRDPGIPWDDRIPYPIFAIGAHLYLKDCPLLERDTYPVRPSRLVRKPAQDFPGAQVRQMGALQFVEQPPSQLLQLRRQPE